MDAETLKRDRASRRPHLRHRHDIRSRKRLRQSSFSNTDASMRVAADATWSLLDSMPHSDYIVPEKTPVESALGNGRTVDQTH